MASESAHVRLTIVETTLRKPFFRETEKRVVISERRFAVFVSEFMPMDSDRDCPDPEHPERGDMYLLFTRSAIAKVLEYARINWGVVFDDEDGINRKIARNRRISLVVGRD